MFSLRTSLLDNVDGSAELTVDGTKVIVSVTGPIEPKPRQELPTLASLEIVVRPSSGVSSTREKLLEDKVRVVLQDSIIRYKYPRQLIQVVVQFLVTEGNDQKLIGKNAAGGYTSNELCSALNCTYFALLDANIALYNSFAAVSMCINEDIVIDPKLNDLVSSKSHHVVCFDIREAKSNKVLLVESHGSFTEEDLLEVLDTASARCEEIHQTQRTLVEEKVRRDFIWRSHD